MLLKTCTLKKYKKEKKANNKNIKEYTNIHSHNVVPRVDPFLRGKRLAVLFHLFVGALMIAALLDESRTGINSRLILVAVEWFVVATIPTHDLQGIAQFS